MSTAIDISKESEKESKSKTALKSKRSVIIVSTICCILWTVMEYAWVFASQRKIVEHYNSTDVEDGISCSEIPYELLIWCIFFCIIWQGVKALFFPLGLWLYVIEKHESDQEKALQLAHDVVYVALPFIMFVMVFATVGCYVIMGFGELMSMSLSWWLTGYTDSDFSVIKLLKQQDEIMHLRRNN